MKRLGIRYVTNADGKVWLKVRHKTGGTYPPLPQFLKVEVLDHEGWREHFKILEGRNKGKIASVVFKSPSSSYLSDKLRHKPGQMVRFQLTLDVENVQTLSGTVLIRHAKISGTFCKFDAITMARKPVPMGTHDLEIPYEIHPKASGYSDWSPFVTTWFRVGHAGDRFLHPGRLSFGCATVRDLSAWTRIYNVLIAARSNDRSVGRISVS
jgi:hypothetical protein